MCGGAAEAILLAIAIAKRGDENELVGAYRGAMGRSRVESMISDQLNAHLRQQIQEFTALLKYWRDSAVHITAWRLTEQEAFMAMLLLLRFSAFTSERWDELVGKPPGSN